MLKLTNSFCRYLWLTCETVFSKRVQVRKLSLLSSRRNSTKNCVIKSLPFLTSFVHSENQVRLFASHKKRSHFKRSFPSSNALKKNKQMSESLQPTLGHVSYGGKFEISANEDGSSHNQWEHDEEGSSGNSRGHSRRNDIPPDFRVWETVGRRNDSADGSCFKFKVVSYNVLAQYLLECHPYLYRSCSSYDLKWKVRSSRLYAEILQLDPDILCLQEVQVSHLDSFYEKFEEIGYYGIYKQKTGHRQDGCAIYFKKSLFKLEDHITVEFYQPELPILNRDNIGLIVKLRPRLATSSPLVVATTHLLYNPKRTDVRLAQMQVLLAEIDRFAYYHNGRESGHLPIILTGDLNSPFDSSVVRLLDTGYVCAERDTSDWQRIGVTDNCQHLAVYLARQKGDKHTSYRDLKLYNSEYGERGPEVSECGQEFSSLFNSSAIQHGLGLVSAYDRYKPSGETEATTFQEYWITVDYIYFSCYSNLSLVERLRLPTAQECEALGIIPNHVYASDHLALGAVFQMKPHKCSL